MRIQITKPGIYGADGQEVSVGTELTVKDEPKGWKGRYTVLSEGEAKAKGGRGGKGGKDAVTNPKTFEAKAKGGGFVITDGDGAEYGEPLSEADAKAFNEMSDTDKTAFAAEHAKG